MSNFRPLLAIAVFSCLPASLQAGETDNHSDAAAATLRQYDVEPTTSGVMGVLRQWRPDAENRARIARLVRDLGDDRWGVREAANRQLAGMGTLAEPALREALKSIDAEVVFRARKLVAGFPQGHAEEVLSAALEWLRQYPTPQATPLLLDLLPVLPDSFQSSTRDALWVCAGRDNVPRLRQAIGDARPALREAAIVALERAAGADALPDLEPLLRDKSEATRLAAARALLDRLPRPSIAALLDLLDARAPEIRAQAAWLLQQVSGIPRDDDPSTDLAAPQLRAECAQQWKTWATSDAAGHPQPVGPKRLQLCGYAQLALRFDGQPGSYVEIPNLDMSCLTFATWIKRDVTGEKQDLIMSARMGGWGVFVSEGPRNSNDYLCFTHRGVGQWHSESTIADKEWHLAAITLDSNSLKFYIDGKPAGNAAVGGPINNGGGGYWLGSEVKDNPGQSCSFQGRLREMLIFNRALRPAEIAQLYQRGRGARSAIRDDRGPRRRLPLG